jgi:signal peptidase I
MKRLLYLLFLGVAGALILRNYVFEGVYIASGSMEPTLSIGRHLFVNKFVYHFRGPARGEIVVFQSPVEQKDLVKRVIALPGDTVQLKDKKVILNGAALNEPYVKYVRPDEILRGDNIAAQKVPAGTLFVMGDNRDQSGDSRDWIDPATGEHIYFVKIKDIKGKVLGENL